MRVLAGRYGRRERMLIEDVTTEEFTGKVRLSEAKIVLYGVGVIGKITAPQFLSEQGLTDRVLFFVDADEKKQGEKIKLAQRETDIRPPELLGRIKEKFVILITGSRYESILAYLNGQPFLENVHGYILPQMLAKEAKAFATYRNIRRSLQPLIPKRIHYCWFGKNAMPEPLQKCIDTWRKCCPDYEIVRWDESNYDVDRYRYTRQAYERRKWAFVSDVARLDILYHHGGIYLDTDVELIKNLDDLLYQPAFCSVEKWGVINTGGGCGAVPEHPMIAKMMELRKKTGMVYEDGTINMESSGFYESMPLMEEGFVPDNTVQIVKDMTIYSSDFFHPYDYMTRELCVTENTYGIHHFSEAWL